MENANKIIVKVRLMEKRDEKEALRIIWRLIFVKTAMDILVDKITDAPVMLLFLLCGVVGFLQRYSLFQGIVIFLTPPCAIYVLGRFIILPTKYYSSPGFIGGFYKFWSRNEIGRHLWVAEVDGNVIGTAAVEILSATTAQVFRVAVVEKYNGKGIGRQLMNRVLEHCKQKKLEHLVLYTSYAQKPAYKLYEKLGFQKVQTFQDGPPLLKFNNYIYHISPSQRDPGLWAKPGSSDLIFR